MPTSNERIINEVLRQYDEFKNKNPQYRSLIEIITQYHEAENTIKALQIRQKGVFSDMGRNQFNVLIKNQCDTQQQLISKAKEVIKPSVIQVAELQNAQLSEQDIPSVVDAVVAEYLDINQVCKTLATYS